MAEYIEREVALDIIKRTNGDYAAAWTEIQKLPGADVEPVVRCYECRSYNKPRLGWCSVHLETSPLGGYCYWGTKR